MLDTQITFYVPSTQEGSNTTSTQEFNTRVDDIAGVFGSLFGGFTVSDGVGGWVMESGQLVKESIKKVSSYTDTQGVKNNLPKIKELAQAKKLEWGQEAISLEVVKVSGGLSFI